MYLNACEAVVETHESEVLPNELRNRCLSELDPVSWKWSAARSVLHESGSVHEVPEDILINDELVDAVHQLLCDRILQTGSYSIDEVSCASTLRAVPAPGFQY